MRHDVNYGSTSGHFWTERLKSLVVVVECWSIKAGYAVGNEKREREERRKRGSRQRKRKGAVDSEREGQE